MSTPSTPTPYCITSFRFGARFNIFLSTLHMKGTMTCALAIWLAYSGSSIDWTRTTLNTPAYLLSEDSCFVNSYPDGKAVPQKTTLYSLLVVGRCLHGVAIGEDSVTVGSSPNGFAGMVRQPPISFLGGLGGGDVCDAEFVCSVSFVGNPM